MSNFYRQHSTSSDNEQASSHLSNCKEKTDHRKRSGSNLDNKIDSDYDSANNSNCGSHDSFANDVDDERKNHSSKSSSISSISFENEKNLNNPGNDHQIQMINHNNNNYNNLISNRLSSQNSDQMNHIIQMTTGNVGALRSTAPPVYEPLVQHDDDDDQDEDCCDEDCKLNGHHSIHHHPRRKKNQNNNNNLESNGHTSMIIDNSIDSPATITTSAIEPINCHGMVEIVRSKPKKSMRISFMVLFKSCFGRGPMMMRILSALFFAISSFLLVVINKIVLTTFHFPSVLVLGLGQVIATIVILNICRRLNIIKFPYYSREVNAKMFPLPFFYLGNLVAGLGSTKRLNLPMLTVLRRFTILMTMIGEFYLLGINQSLTIKMTVFMMIGGAVIAASNDLAFDAAGYVYVLLNDIFSTFNGIYMKKKLDSRDLGKYGILYYNALFIVFPMFIISMCVDDWRQCFLEFEHWNSPMFVVSFLMSCVMGFVLMYSTALCTQHNSALTTTIVGCLKNILVTFIGMYIGGDYIFSMVNFVGLNISMIGSLIYSYVIFVHKSSKTSTLSTKQSSGGAGVPNLAQTLSSSK